jgi:hypothetical protein
MSSGWIKFDKDMVDDPRLMTAATKLLDRYQVSVRTGQTGFVDLSKGDAVRYACNALRGALVTLWRYADEHVRDDDTVTCTVTEIDALVGIDGFCDVMPASWLVTSDDGSRVKLPGYCVKNSLSSKRKKSDKSADRQRRYRERLKGQRERNVTRDVTDDKSVSLGGDLDQDLLGIRKEKEPPVSPEGSAGKKPKPSSAKVPLPDDFGLTPDRAAYARQNLPGVDVDEAMAVFQTTWRSRGDRYADWDQHWQNCVRQWRANSGHWTAGKYPRLPQSPNGTGHEPDPWTVPA